MKKTLIPTEVTNRILSSIDSSLQLRNIKPKQKLNLVKRLTSLWLYIYEQQKNDCKTLYLTNYVNIPSNDLSSFTTRVNNKTINYNYLLELLEKKELILINDKYSTSNFTKSYKINTKIFTEDYTEVEIDFDKIYKNFKDKKYWLKKYPKHKKQINELYNTRIDLGKYIKWLNNNKGEKLKPIFKEGRLKRRFLTPERMYDYINDVLKINFQNIWVKISNEGRFYSSLTNLSSTAIPFLKLRRRQLKEIDVVNCQPLLLSLFLNNKEYKEDVESGLFYDKLSKVINKDRTETKILTYRYLFFTNKELKSGMIYEGMEKLYKGVIEEINELRTKINIPLELQRLESEIFVDNISNIEDINLITRHDSVLCCYEDYEIMKEYIKDEFKKKGLKVTLK